MTLRRRQFLKMMGGGVAAASVSRRAWGAAKGPVRVGFIAPLSGPFAQNGRDMWDGFRLYFEEIGFQAAGRTIEVLSEDSWVEPAEALTKLRKLVEKDRVHVASGGLLGPTPFALQGYVTSQNLPFVLAMLAADDLTQRKIVPWFVRVGWTASQPTQPFAEYCYKTLGYRRVAGLNFDFAFGYETFGGFHRVFEDLGGKVVQKLWVPAAVADFAPYLAVVKRDIDALFAAFTGAPALRFLRQAVEYGLKGKMAIIGTGILTDEHILPSMGDEALGVVTALHYSAALDSPANKRFRSAYEKLAGRVPSYYAAISYTSARWIVEALKAVAGDIENREQYLAALKKVEVTDDPRGPIKIDAWGNPIQNIYVRKVERVGGQLQNSVIHTYSNVSQFWTYRPEEFLRNPVYDREKFPGCRFCE